MIPFPYNQKLIFCKATTVSFECNNTGLLRQLQVKIENIYLLKIMILKTRKRLKKLVLPKCSLAAQKVRVAQNLGGGCSLPRPPGPYAYASSIRGRVKNKLLLAWIYI